MKKTLLPIAILSILATAEAQKSTKAFAITDAVKGGYQWNQIQAIDLKTGTILNTLVDGRNYASLTNDNIQAAKGVPAISPMQSPVGSASATLAYDANNNRLYFSPMFQPGEIRYFNLNDKQPSVHVVSFTQKMNNPGDREADNFTRMVIGSDGNGYAITNDANTFIRFSTGKNAVVENLGAMVDAEKNGGISVHNKCSSWGGDMIATAFGKLIMFTAKQTVFEIDPSTRIATYLGNIKGLPNDFTCNGAAVNADGNIILSSAVKTAGYFQFNLETLNATLLPGSENAFTASDLATSNLLGQNKIDNSLLKMATIAPLEIGNDKISIFPNPVTTGIITVSFNKMSPGNYTITLADLAGKNLVQKQVTISGKGQTATINADSKLAKGLYFVKVNGADKSQEFSTKILVQ